MTKKEKDNIYWGKTESLEIKFSSDENLREGEQRFVHYTEVIEQRPFEESFKGYKEI